jgi:hypothetical protein
MAYISSNANRWYCALESVYGQLPAITAGNRIPAVKLGAQQQRAKSQRRDKTGTRTFPGNPTGMRRQTSFDLTSYLRNWADTSQLPTHGPLVSAAMGGAGNLWEGGTAAAGSTTTQIQFTGPHNLAAGQALVCAGEIRFVATVPSSTTVTLNTALSAAPAAGTAIGATATYSLTSELPSLSLFDYWDPSTAVQRAVTGAAVDQMTLSLNGDFHQFEFKGSAQDLLDSASFVSGQGGATQFPAEPAQSGFTYSPVPGNLGEVWLGTVPNQFFTVSTASIELANNVNLRLNEYGSILPQAIAPGTRQVTVSLELYGQDDVATTALYQAARLQAPISMMFQMGQVNGQLLGVYLKSVVPQIPEFDDSDNRLKWKFSDTEAQGTGNDELVVAFG